MESLVTLEEKFENLKNDVGKLAYILDVLISIKCKPDRDTREYFSEVLTEIREKYY